MALGAETFTVLAVLDAQDKASSVWDRMTGFVDRFAESMGRAAETTKASGDEIDESLLKTASDTDALDLASARVEAALAKQAITTRELATAERELMDASTQLATAADTDALAEQRAATAADGYAAAQKRAADAAKAVRDAQAGQAAVSDTLAASQDTVAAASDKSSGKLSSVAGTIGKIGLGMDIAGGLMVRAAGNFESSTTHLTTDAGEVQSQLGRVQAGMLQIGAATGTTSSDISQGMYHIESSLPQVGDAATRATTALNILQTAAQGAKVGNASLDTVSKALVGTMNAYSDKGYTATQMMNALITTVGAGDMKMEDLAGGLGNVAPLAAAAGLGFEQVGGAIAVMTSQNMSADQSMQDIANTIRSLQNPNNVAIQEMQQLGLSANDVSNNLGKRGLTGTLDILTTALAKHTQGGQVFIDTMKNSQIASQNLKTAMAQLPAGMQTMAKGLLDGSVSAAEWTKAAKDLPVGQQNIAKQFLQMAKQADSFNQLLKSGKPEAQTFNAALAQMMGGATGLNTALMLTGPNMVTYQANVDKIGDSLKSKAKDVDNWQAIQGTFNQKMDRAKVSVENTGIAIGTALLPGVKSMADAVMKVLGPVAQWAEGHQKLAGIVFGSIAGFATLVGVINLGVKAFNAVKGAVDAVNSVFGFFGRILGITKKAEAEVSAGADTMAKRSTQASQATAEGWGEVATGAEGATVATEEATVATEGSTVAAEENAVAANASSTGWLRAGLNAAGAAIKFVAVKTAQIAVTVATNAWTAAQWLFNAAMDASPIMIVVLAIAALVAGVIYAYTHFKVFRDVVQDIMDFFKKVIKETIDFVKAHWDLILGIIVGPLALVIAEVVKHWTLVKQYFMDGVHAVENVLSWFGSLPGKFGQWLGDMVNTISNKIGDAVKWFKNLPNTILDLLKDAGTWLVNVGEDIIKGLAAGIGNMVGWLEQQVKNIGGGIVSSIKSFLHIGSPSKLMADEVGMQIPAGIAQGIIAGMPKIADAMRNVGGVAISATGIGGSVSIPATTTVSGGGASGGGVYIDMRGVTVMTERDMDVWVAKLGRALGPRILASGGVRLAM